MLCPLFEVAGLMVFHSFKTGGPVRQKFSEEGYVVLSYSVAKPGAIGVGDVGT